MRLLSGSRGGHEFRSLGTLELKGIPEPVGAADVAWTPAAAALAAPLPGPLAPDEGEWPFAGRDVALDQLGAEWKAAAAGERRVVMIAGEPGIGKTRLVAELARSVHADGALVLLGRTDEHVDAPYGPWREALRALVRSAPEEILGRHVAEHGGELARIVPELARRVERLPAAVATDPETERLLLFEAVAGLVAATSAEAPVLLVLDDLHWADRSTLLLLLHLLKADAPASLLVVATYRDTDVDRAHPLAGVLADLRRQRGVSRLTLGGLDGDGIAALLERAGGQDLDDAAREFAATLWRDTDGNPFFVREVLLHLIETGGLVQTDGRWRPSATLDAAGLPEGVREVIGRRLAELPDVTNTMLGAASVIGREFDTGLLAEIAGESADAVLEALEPAERARLIGDVPGRPGRYSFAHALVRTVLVDELGTNRRVRLHRAAGVALEAQPDPPLGELAYHFGEAAVMGETDRAVRYARAAAEQALHLAAPEEAVTFARHALNAAKLGDVADSERPGLLLLLGRALDGSGALDEAKDVVADAYARAVQAGDIETACEAAIAYGSGNAFFFFSDDRGPAQLRGALGLLPSGDSMLHAGVLARYVQWLRGAPGEEGLRVARESYDMAVRLDAQDVRQVAANAVAFMVTSIDPAAQLRFSEEALAIAVAESGRARLDAYAQLAEARLVFGDLDGADAAIVDMDVAFEASSLRALPGYRTSHRGVVGGWRIVRALIAGRFADAEAIVAERDAMPPEDFGAHFAAANGRTQIAYLRGDWKGATACWAEVRSIVPAATEPYFGYLGTGGDIDRPPRVLAPMGRRRRTTPRVDAARQHRRARRESAPAGGTRRGRGASRRVRRPLRLLLHQRTQLVLRTVRHRARHPRRDRRRPRHCARAPHPCRRAVRSDRVAYLGFDRTPRTCHGCSDSWRIRRRGSRVAGDRPSPSRDDGRRDAGMARTTRTTRRRRPPTLENLNRDVGFTSTRHRDPLGRDEHHAGSRPHEEPSALVHQPALDEADGLAEPDHLALTHQRPGLRGGQEADVHVDRRGIQRTTALDQHRGTHRVVEHRRENPTLHATGRIQELFGADEADLDPASVLVVSQEPPTE